MYIKRTHRHYKGKTYTNHLLVESVHTAKGPRHKVICSLGDLRPRPREEWLKLAHRIEEALSGQESLLRGDDAEVARIVRQVRARPSRGRKRGSPEPRREIVSVCTEGVRTEGHREAGAVHVGHQMWERLGMGEVLAGQGLRERTRRIAEVMVLNRLCEPLSEHAMPGWMGGTALGDILGADVERYSGMALYRTMDRVLPHREAVEGALAAREAELFNLDQTVLLYDLTSTYFEGLAEGNAKAKRGYSRDKRPDCKQVVVGLVVNRDGFPKAHEVFDGNRQDRTTLDEMLRKLDQRVGLRPGQTVVVDRGMAYEENIEQIRRRGLHYVVATRQSERDEWLDEFEDLKGFAEITRKPSATNPFQKKSRVWVKGVAEAGLCYAMCKSEGREQKDRAIRLKQEARLREDLAGLQERVAGGHLVKAALVHEAIGRLKERYGRVARYYQMTYDEGSHQLRWEVNRKKLEVAEGLDGTYLLKTDRSDLSAEDIWRIYVLLTRAEKAFRNMTSPLAERPIFHQITRRVDAHIFLCVLAYHLLVAIEKTLMDHGVYTSWWNLRRTLKRHGTCTVVLPTDTGEVLRIRRGSIPDPDVARVYKELAIPTEVMKPIRTWSSQGRHRDAKKKQTPENKGANLSEW